MSFYVYMVECSAESIYIGHSDNLEPGWPPITMAAFADSPTSVGPSG